ncbi:MAG TPA: hypothetical protein VER17_09350 [Tepidisphaeraceae bacterium]|nr:hypothetical protein [Tepidisphaeraceae bacterium]
MYDLIMPAAGGSTRFAGTRPKWLLTHPLGDLMFYEALRGLDLSKFDRIFITCLQQHDEKFHCVQAIRNQTAKRGLADKVRVIVLPEPTRHQPQTVAETIKRGEITGAFVVKDSDNYFELTPEPTNFISVCDATQLPPENSVNVFNKSFVQENEHGVVVNIAEKQVISKNICTGAYGFSSADQFMKYYEPLAAQDNLYLSHVIYSMILDNHNFFAKECFNYLDWGTLDDWLRYTAEYATIFIDLDGTLVQNSAEHFDPIWGTTAGIRENIDAVNALYHSNKVRIVITTTRSEAFREQTVGQLEREGIKYHDLMLGLSHGKRVIVNDFAPTNPYRSCDAINIPRNSPTLATLIRGTFGRTLHLPTR